MWKKEDKLIRDLLLNSFGAFFLSMLTSSLGSGMSNGCARALGNNDREQACRLYSVTRIAGIGLRLTMNLAKEVTYTSAMRLNNVTIKV